MENETKTRAVFAALTGKPNAGKSSLTNALVGEKIAMISDKPQTTRTKITGILTEGDLQYVFIDTPGIHKSKDKLGTHMNRSVRNAVADIDMAVNIIFNAKTQRMGVCNACESLLVHENIASTAIPAICASLQAKDIEIRAGQRAFTLLELCDLTVAIGKLRLMRHGHRRGDMKSRRIFFQRSQRVGACFILQRRRQMLLDVFLPELFRFLQNVFLQDFITLKGTHK